MAEPFSLSELVLATGALGTAAFGIVEASKWLSAIGESGFSTAWSRLGALRDALQVAYGSDHQRLLRGLYRGDQKNLVRTLRQGVRVGITPENAASVAAFLGSINGTRLAAAVTKAQEARELTTEERGLIGRFELAADARIDAALAVAQSVYTGTARVLASVAAVALAIAVQQLLADLAGKFWPAVFIGIAAVPIAPVAKDIASGIAAASRALRMKG